MMILEMQSLFTQILEQAGIVSREQLPLFFEACKLLDMMLVVGFDDFQLYLPISYLINRQARMGVYNRYN